MFGEVVKLIEFHKNWDNKLGMVLSELDEDDLITFHSFSLTFAIYKDGFEKFVRVVNEIPYNTTILNKYPDINDKNSWLEGCMMLLLKLREMNT